MAEPGVYVEFRHEPEQDEAASHRAGRWVGRDVEMVRLTLSGGRTVIPLRVTDEIRGRYRAEYEAWKRGEAAPPDGLSLKQWPAITRSRAEELCRIGVRTLEDLAAASDSLLHRMGSGARPLRTMAQAWLDAARGTGVAAEEIARLRRENAALADRVRVLTEEAEAATDSEGSRAGRVGGDGPKHGAWPRPGGRPEMTLLALIQSAADELGLPRPSVAVSSVDPTARQLLALANREGRMLAQRHEWQALTREGRFATVAAESQGAIAGMAPDFAKFLNGGLYDRSHGRRIDGPLSAQAWQRERHAPSAAASDRFRIRGGAVLLTPPPEAGREICFEYVSRSWCRSADGAGQDAWRADSDSGILDEDLIALGVKWRFLRAKSLGYSEEFRDYETRLYDARASDGAKPILDLAGPDLRAARGAAPRVAGWEA